MSKRSLEDFEAEISNKIHKIVTDILVLHIRNLCPNITEKEIVQLGFPFGKIRQLILLKAKNQAFIEFFDQDAVNNMLDYYNNSQNETSLRGYKIYVQKSKHEHLNTSNIPPAAAAVAKSIVNTMNALYDANSTQELPSNIIRIKLDGDPSFLNLNVITQVFSRYGPIQKIITFYKNNSFQSFVQYPCSAMAQMARLNLCGMHLNSCHISKIDFSKLQDLEIKQNNDKMHDYTQETNNIIIDKTLNGKPENNLIRIEPPTTNSILSSLVGQGYTLVPLITNNYGQSHQNNPLGGNVLNNPNMRNSNAASLQQLQQILNANHLHHQQSLLNSNSILGKQPIIIGLDSGMSSNNGSLATAYVIQSNASNLNSPALNLSSNDSGILSNNINLTAASTNLNTGSSVIIVSNFNEERVTADALFILFGVYGDVLKVKILFNKRDTALIQLSNPTQAHLVINNLDNLKMYGKQIRVSLSKYQTIKMPKDEQGDVVLTKDYSNSTLHRFKKLGSKNYNNIFPPSPILHLSNIPIETEEESVLNIFTNNGFAIQKFKYFVNEKRMALVQMKDIEEAVSALIELHNHPITNTHNLRISFSKSHF